MHTVHSGVQRGLGSVQRKDEQGWMAECFCVGCHHQLTWGSACALEVPGRDSGL
ncbi:hypothetical protein GQ54DRAFT_299984, partial [Martensiomyces pterosporus]